MKTTIQIDLEVKKKLDELKIHKRESYSSVIKRLIDSVFDDEPISKETLEEIEKSLEDIRAGRLYTMDEIRRMVGEE